MQPHRGGIVLTLGILGLILCTPLAPIAWSMGASDLLAMRTGRMDPSGMGVTQAGYVCGIIGTVLLVVELLGLCVYLGLVLAAISAATQ